MAQVQKESISAQEFEKNHAEKEWRICDTGTRRIAFKHDENNHFIIDRIEKTDKGWRELGRITGNLPWYAGYKKGCALSDFFSGLTSASQFVRGKIEDGTITIANPLSKKLDKLMLAAIVIEELIPIKEDVDSMVDIAYVLFTSDLSKTKSTDAYGSVGVFQTLPKTHDLIKGRYPSLVNYSFKDSDTYEEQAVVAILLAYDNLAVFNKDIFQKYGSLQVAWNSASEKEQLEFTVFVVAAMHNAPSSTLKAFKSALNVLASGNFTLTTLMGDVARELDETTTSPVGTGTYAQRVVQLYDRLNERGFANFQIYPGEEASFVEGFKQKTKDLVYKKAK
ncbi:MAG: hypothetical protein ACPL06_04215 [Candidatus Anstonellales archaeon]